MKKATNKKTRKKNTITRWNNFYKELLEIKSSIIDHPLLLEEFVYDVKKISSLKKVKKETINLKRLKNIFENKYLLKALVEVNGKTNYNKEENYNEMNYDPEMPIKSGTNNIKQLAEKYKNNYNKSSDEQSSTKAVVDRYRQKYNTYDMNAINENKGFTNEEMYNTGYKNQKDDVAFNAPDIPSNGSSSDQTNFSLPTFKSNDVINNMKNVNNDIDERMKSLIDVAQKED